MSAVLGVVLFTLAVLTFGVALVVARKPDPPGWLTEGLGGSLITITTIAFAVTGLGLVVQFAVSYGREPVGAKEIVLIGISLMLLTVVFTGIAKALRRSGTTGSPQTSAVGNVPSAVVVKDDPSRSDSRKRLASKRAA
jgi:amino acid permease